jgi:transposase
VPRVLGIDDFALRRGSVYATVLIDAETGRRVDIVPGRTAGLPALLRISRTGLPPPSLTW